MVISSTINAQDIVNLNSVSCIGIRYDKREPVTLTKINCDSISFLNQQNDPFFILDKVSPSVYSQSDNGQSNGYSYIRMRGLDQTRINFNLNGIPLNEMEDQGIYFSNMPGFYNYISRISIQRGVGTSKYGNTSIGGSVNMESRDMTQRTSELSTLLRSNLTNNSWTNYFYSSGINKKNISFQIGTSYNQGQGFKDHSGNIGGSIFYGIGLYKKYDIIKIYGFSGLTYNQLSFYGVPMDSIKNNYKMNLNSVNDKDTFNQNFISANWVRFKNDKLKFNTSTYFSNVNGTYNTGGLLFGVNSYQFGGMSNIVYQTDRRTTNFGINANFYNRKHFGYDNDGLYDIPENTSRYQNTGYKKDFIAYIKVIESNRNGNLFADLQFRNVWFDVRDNLSSSYNYRWSFLNPKVGYKQNNSYIIGSITQREPTRADISQNAIQQIDNNINAENPDNFLKFDKNTVSKLKPERVSDIEIGTTFHIGFLKMNINGYLMFIDNEFIATGIIDQYSGFMTKRSNKSTTFRGGIESDGTIKLNSLNLFYTLQLQHNSIDGINSKYKITFTPNVISSLGASYKITKIVIGTTSQYVSKMAMNIPINSPQQFSDPYLTSNGYINYNVKNITLCLNVNNIFNSKYYIPAGMGHNDANWNYHDIPTYYVGQTINWNLSAKYKF